MKTYRIAKELELKELQNGVVLKFNKICGFSAENKLRLIGMLEKIIDEIKTTKENMNEN